MQAPSLAGDQQEAFVNALLQSLVAKHVLPAALSSQQEAAASSAASIHHAFAARLPSQREPSFQQLLSQICLKHILILSVCGRQCSASASACMPHVTMLILSPCGLQCQREICTCTPVDIISQGPVLVERTAKLSALCTAAGAQLSQMAGVAAVEQLNGAAPLSEEKAAAVCPRIAQLLQPPRPDSHPAGTPCAPEHVCMRPSLGANFVTHTWRQHSAKARPWHGSGACAAAGGAAAAVIAAALQLVQQGSAPVPVVSMLANLIAQHGLSVSDAEAATAQAGVYATT